MGLRARNIAAQLRAFAEDDGASAVTVSNTNISAANVATLSVSNAAVFSNTVTVAGLITGTITTANNTTYLNGQPSSYYANSTAPGTAYSNAVSTASSDATSKAATAYSNATSYAASIAATAYSNATSYAASVAATAYSNAISSVSFSSLLNKTSGSGTYTTSGDFRAPIFYDSNNTAYYTDPASVSIFSDVRINDGSVQLRSANVGRNTKWRALEGSSDVGISFYDANDRWAAQFYANYGDGYGFLNGNWASWDLKKVTSGNLYMNNNTSYYLNAPGDNYLYRVYGAADIRSPIYYDNNDTGYYLDANGTSRFNRIDPNEIYNYGWFRNHEINEGLYNQATGTHFYSNGGASWGITGSGGNVELQFRSNHQSTVRGYVYGDTSSNFGLLNQNGSWKVRVNGSETEIYDYCYTNDLRTYITYDRNDTGYYSDPNGGSSFNGMTTNNHYIRPGYMLYSDHGSWQGEYNKIQWHSSHLYLQNAGGGYLLILRRGDGGERFWCDYNGNVTASGNITAYSDISLKTNVKTIENARSLRRRLRGVTFDWIASGEHSYGLIAQEVEQVVPELVMETQNGTADGDDKKSIKSVDYSKLVSILIQDGNEQDDIIEDLTCRVKALEDAVAKLTAAK